MLFDDNNIIIIEKEIFISQFINLKIKYNLKNSSFFDKINNINKSLPEENYI